MGTPLFNTGRGPTSAGPQYPGAPIAGLPPRFLPGFSNGVEAERARRTVAGSPPPIPPVTPDVQCAINHLVRCMCDCIEEVFRNNQFHARRPSHIDIPFGGICFDRHRGTGAVGTPDPPIVIPVVAVGGPFSPVIDFTVDEGARGELKGWGVNVTPAASGSSIEWRITVNGLVVSPFDVHHGGFGPPGGTGSWFGPPFTIFDLDRDVCIHLHPKDTVVLEARNAFLGAPVNAAGRIIGWTYRPTIDATDETIRATMTDQR